VQKIKEGGDSNGRKKAKAYQLQGAVDVELYVEGILES
jgi:hypothetical protein